MIKKYDIRYVNSYNLAKNIKTCFVIRHPWTSTGSFTKIKINFLPSLFKISKNVATWHAFFFKKDTKLITRQAYLDEDKKKPRFQWRTKLVFSYTDFTWLILKLIKSRLNLSQGQSSNVALIESHWLKNYCCVAANKKLTEDIIFYLT